jgi:tRNA(fMet)-specific endonuclease VapC
MRYLLDTNTCSYALRQVPSVVTKLKGLSPSDIAVSTVTLAEAWTGCVRSSAPQRWRAAWDVLVSPWSVLPFDRDAAEQYADIRADLETRGVMIGGNDCQIAAIARAHRLTVVTHDVDEFSRVQSLDVEDWLTE